MRYLLDAYNIVHITGILPPEWAGIDIKELSKIIKISRFGGYSVTLVCDGTPTKDSQNIEQSNNLTIKFAGGGLLADDLIRKIVSLDSSPKSICVVTDDREIQRDVKKRDCKIMSSSSFLKKITLDLKTKKVIQKNRKPSNTTESEKNKWLKIFKTSKERNTKLYPNNKLDARLNKMLEESKEIIKKNKGEQL